MVLEKKCVEQFLLLSLLNAKVENVQFWWIQHGEEGPQRDLSNSTCGYSLDLVVNLSKHEGYETPSAFYAAGTVTSVHVPTH